MRSVICLILILMAGAAGAQTDSLFPLRGKTVAVYFSSKQFSFDATYRIPLSQFIRADEGRDADIEDVKTQTLIALGTLFSRQLGAATRADSVFFLNEFPRLARGFIGSYDSEARRLEPLGATFDGVDYVLVVNPFSLGSYKKSAVYTRSNRIITEQVVVRSARIRFELFDPQSGIRRHMFEACMDERKTEVPETLFEFHMKSSQTGKFLARLFSLATLYLNAGEKGNCPSD